MAQHRYVVGFAFTSDRKAVLLIRKTRPRWQAGLLNGVGGHVEEGETFLAAMAREFEEESALVVPEDAWKHVLVVQGADYELHVFGTVTDTVLSAKQTTDEELVLLELTNLWTAEVIPNLRWMIPLCLDGRVSCPFRIVEG